MPHANWHTGSGPTPRPGETEAEFLRRVRESQGTAPPTGTLGLPQAPSGTPPPAPSSPTGVNLGPGPNIPAPIVPTISAGGNVQQRIQQQALQNAPAFDPRLLQAGRGTNRAPEPALLRTQGELSISRESGAGLVIDPFGFSTTPERARAALTGAVAGFAPRLPIGGFPTEAAGPPAPSGGGFAGEVSPEAMRQFAGVSAVKVWQAMEAGNYPAWLTPAQIDSWIDIFDLEGPQDQIATDLGYRFNPETGLWERLDPIQFPTTSTYGGRPISGFGGYGGGSVYSAPGTFPRATRGYSGGGLVNWRI